MVAPDQVNIAEGRANALKAKSKLPFKNVPKRTDVGVLVEVADNNQAVAWGGVCFDHGLCISDMAVWVPPQVVPMRVDEKKRLARLLVEEPSIGARTVTVTSSRSKTLTSVAKELEAFRIVQSAKRSVHREQLQVIMRASKVTLKPLPSAIALLNTNQVHGRK